MIYRGYGVDCQGGGGRRPGLHRNKAHGKDLGLQGLRVMVSAGPGGIGLAIARAFVREGPGVAMCDGDAAALAVPALRASANASIALAGRLGFAPRTLCAAANWGVIGLMRSLAIELGPNIRDNALLPGIVVGEREQRVLTAKAQARGVAFEEVEQSAFGGTSIKQYVTAEQLADYVVYLASPRAATIAGQALSVCGDTNMLS